MIISKDLRGRLLDVNVLRGPAKGMSDQYLVEGRIKASWNSSDGKEGISRNI